MFIVFPVVAATVLVTIGYFVMWTSSQGSTPKGLSVFGKVMSIILFVMAGLVILASLTCGPKKRWTCPGMSYMYGGKKKARYMRDEMHKKGDKPCKGHTKKYSGKMSGEDKGAK